MRHIYIELWHICHVDFVCVCVCVCVYTHAHTYLRIWTMNIMLSHTILYVQSCVSCSQSCELAHHSRGWSLLYAFRVVSRTFDTYAVVSCSKFNGYPRIYWGSFRPIYCPGVGRGDWTPSTPPPHTHTIPTNAQQPHAYQGGGGGGESE